VGQVHSTTGAVRFGEFRLNLQTGELCHDGDKPASMPEQPFQILAMLLARPGSLVTREEIRSALWPNGTVVEFEHSINAAINRLRQILGDAPESPRFVETIPRRGYRFVGSLDTADPAIAAEQNDQGNRRGVRYVLALAALVVIAAGALWFASFRNRSAQPGSPVHIRSLAVLPLENLSGDASRNYFVDGITDELTTELAKHSDLRVISRTSAVLYGGTHKPVPQIARELQVDGVVEGSVTLERDRVHIRIQLIDGARDQHVWAATYERSVSDVLQFQAEAARDIASEIQLQLGDKNAQRTHHEPTPEVHELYLKGRYFWNKREGAGYQKAAEYFRQAIAKDPSYAQAYAGLADAYLFAFSTDDPPGGTVAGAKAAAARALELDDTLAEAHASLGLIAANNEWNWEEAEKQYLRAIALSPNYATAHHWYSETFLMSKGRMNDALAEIHKAQELDPLSPIINTDIARELAFARQYDKAIAQLKKALELDANFALAHYWLWYAYTESGRCNEARGELEQLAERGPGGSRWERAFLEAKCGNKPEARAILNQILRLEKGHPRYAPFIAYVYIALGEKDKAFVWLEKAYEGRFDDFTTMKVASLWDPIRTDPRFADLQRRVGLL